MSKFFKNTTSIKDVPKIFSEETVKRISRIESLHSVIGTMFLEHGLAQMYTVPETMAQILIKKLPILNSAMHRALTEITWHINTVHPIVDRLMDDDSVEGVVMTNKEGNPVLTNVSVTSATRYALNLHRYGLLAQSLVKELDPFNDVLVVRLQTKKIEIMMALDCEFNIIVVQHSRHKKKEIPKKKK